MLSIGKYSKIKTNDLSRKYLKESILRKLKMLEGQHVMKENKKNSIRIKEGTYIVNANYEIIYMDPNLKKEFRDIHDKSICYSTLRGENQPCKDCPMHEFTNQNASVCQKLHYNKIFKKWVECAMMKFHREDDEYTIIHLRQIDEEKRNLYLQFGQEVRYDNLLEFNLTKNTYEQLYMDGQLSTFPVKGNLHTLISTVSMDYIHPNEKSSFQSFLTLSTLTERIEKASYILENFRFLYADHMYHWTFLYIQKVDKLTEEDTYLCFIANIDHKQNIPKRAPIEFTSQSHDALTGLYNESAFHTMVQNRLKEEPATSFGIVNIDIEHFKLFNDWYGTAQGDDLLIYLADQIKKLSAQYNGIASRIGGDDFMILLPKTACHVEILEEQVISWMQNYEVNTKFIPTAGIYLIDDSSTPITLMCDRAAMALGSAKGNFAKRVAIYTDDMKQKLQNEQEVLFGVKYGLEHGEFEIYYQPQCSARTNRIVGAEALVRWNHPTKGMLPPNEFIPILEASGFISKLDYYVWEKVCMFLYEQRKQGKPIVPISVNVSRIDIYQYHIKDVFLELISTYELTPAMIEIEITESAYSENYEQLLQTMEELRKAGFTVLMDDFGSGYSSLNMLKDIEIDVLKIDMKLLEFNEQSRRKGSEILESMIQMAKWLELRIIAEGVEEQEQVDNLLNLECEYMQGYFFYRPMPKHAFMELLGQADKIDTRGIRAERMPTIQLEDLFHKDITSEAMLSNILGGIAIYEVDEQGNLEIKMANDKYYRMTHCNPVDLCERGPFIIRQVHPDDLHIVWDIFNRAEKFSASGASGTFRRYRLSGEIMWMHLHAFYLRKQGTKRIFYGSITDDTENTELQKEIMMLLDTIPGNIVEYHVKGNEIIERRVLSAGLAGIYGYAKEEYQKLLLGQGGKDLLHEDNRQQIIDLITNPSRWTKEMNFECRTLAKDGRTIWIDQNFKFIGEEEDYLIYNSLSTDITRLKH